jgi:hypothetical protein
MKQLYFKNEPKITLEPSSESIQFLLNYSKGLRTIRTVKSQVFLVYLN